MHFKQIELSGFKSFADKLEIKFDSGITAIVGPNGCGKSNVADAIRWVLGEQSSKQLRGSSMQDVIFNGTKKRKSLSYCEASLIFNNQDRFFDYEYDEIAITRKLYRSGESEYLINKQQSRLKDIVNLFYDSGIGRDGYSIIGQGKVEEIISSKPETRRAIFEDAAGIAKFKSRKVEAERKLSRTKDNLTRLRDIIYELEKQLGPLKKQAETAKKYLEFKGELKTLEVNAYIYQHENASELKEKIGTKLSAILEELKLRETEFTAVSEDYEKNLDEVENMDAKISKLHEEILALTVELEKQSGEAKLVKERIAYLNDQNARIETDIKNSNLKIDIANQQKVVKEERINQVKGLINSCEEQINEFAQKLEKVNAELEFLEGEAAEQTKSILDSVEKISDIKSTYSKLRTEQELLLINKQELLDRLKYLDVKIEETSKNKKSLSESLNGALTQSAEYEKQHGILNFKLNQLSLDLKEEEQEKNNLYAKIQVYENRRRLLKEMQAAFEGYSHSVKKLLKESERNSFLKGKMVGVLANLIKVPVKYETAIQVALGNAVQNIVTYDEIGAKQLISHLKENKYGRATFLPITTMKPRRIKDFERQAIKMNGCFGVASELITFDSEIKNVINNLLGATVITDNLDTAIALADKTAYGIKIVTLDGDVVNPQGSYTGGSRKNDSSNLIAREREIKTLAKEIEKLKLAHQQQIQKTSDLAGMIKDVTKQIEENSLLKAQADIIKAKEDEKMFSANTTLENQTAEKSENTNKLTKVNMKLEKIEEELEILGKMQSGSHDFSKNTFNEKDKERLAKVGSLRENRNNLNTQITGQKVKMASFQTEINSLQEDITRISEDVVSTQIILEANQKLLQKNSETLDGAQGVLEEAIKHTSNTHMAAQLEETKRKQKEYSENKLFMQAENKKLLGERNELQDAISELKEKKFKQDAKLEKVDIDIEAMKERIFEEYELSYETCQEHKQEDFDISEGKKNINRLKREINKLGYVNVNAIEDVKVVYERYDTMATQEKDLIKAEDDLVEIISELGTEMEQRFKTEFDKINENFKITFKELFGGGSASLELLDEENILESGVEIIAEPPGKNLKSITLLSGGEKALTAIAILFAILRMRPMPFCLLDEIEAALDEANVERFAQYLRKFSGNTQFIVITHRKPTMELADSLYGVTMEEEGVSRMVSVKLSDAIKNSKESEAV